jgi:hypothetical protein
MDAYEDFLGTAPIIIDNVFFFSDQNKQNRVQVISRPVWLAKKCHK